MPISQGNPFLLGLNLITVSVTFAVVDIETTGNSAQFGGITEIAIVRTDGEKILDKFSSLINPEIAIPGFITNLTGITNEMVADAPTFAEISQTIYERLEGCVFVAHNVNFDLGFITKQLFENGITYAPLKLCTVRYARKVFPGLSSYSLGNLCRHFQITNLNAHRALDDTLATVSLLLVMG